MSVEEERGGAQGGDIEPALVHDLERPLDIPVRGIEQRLDRSRPQQ